MKSSFLYILLLSTLITTEIRAEDEEPSSESSSATSDVSEKTIETNDKSNDELPSDANTSKQLVSEVRSSKVSSSVKSSKSFSTGFSKSSSTSFSESIKEENVPKSNETQIKSKKISFFSNPFTKAEPQKIPIQTKDQDTDQEIDQETDKVLQAPSSAKGVNNSPNTDPKNTSPKTNKYQLSNETRENIKGKFNSFKAGVRSTAKKLMDILNMDLTKLDVRNNTLFLPFYSAYQKLFNKQYKSEAESKQRMSFFKRSIETIKQHNKNSFSKYKQGINEMSDMNLAEIIKYKLGFKKDLDKNLKASVPVPPVTDLPTDWDWRKYGVVTTPRNQGKCGSCWSFAAATVLESHNMKRQIAEGKFDPKKQITVSEQNLIDCSGDYGTIGCDGGMPQQAFKYIAANKGVNGVNTYPYKGKKEKCAYNPANNVDVSVKEGRRLKSGIDKDLATAIYNYGPVAIAIHVTKDMAAYKSGIFEDKKCSAKKVNHAVVAIGYSKDYFIIRNSWGPKWGEDGYIKISRSIENNCGISQQGYYPVIANAVDTKDMRKRLVVVTD